MTASRHGRRILVYQYVEVSFLFEARNVGAIPPARRCWVENTNDALRITSVRVDGPFEPLKMACSSAIPAFIMVYIAKSLDDGGRWASWAVITVLVAAYEVRYTKSRRRNTV